MRRFPEHRHLLGLIGVGAAGVVGALFLFGSSPLRQTSPLAFGQQSSVVTSELGAALTRVSAGERVPVVIQLDRAVAPPPVSLDRQLRAAEQASNLAGLYAESAERLRAALPSDLGIDLLAADVLWIGGAIAASLTPAQIRSLEGQAGLRRVHYDGLVQVDLTGTFPRAPEPLAWAPGLRSAAQDPAGGLPWGLVAIRAPELWEAGATGQGSVVAIVDSGVDGDHPLLRRRWRGLSTSAAEAWFDPWGLSERPVDDDPTGGVGHGTIVTTIAVGSLEPGDTLVEVGGSRRLVDGSLEVVTGVAPGAEWVGVNAFEEFGGGTYTRRSILLQALQWVLDPDGDPMTPSDVPDAVNNSWGFPSIGCDGLFDRAIDALELSGVPVVFAAGNRSAGLDTVATPANRADLLLNAFAVGAAERNEGEIVVAQNSLGGPSPCAPGAVKPEVVAPGEVPIVRNEGLVTAEVRGRSGAFTSWAAPHVTGALAVLKGLNPGAGANDLKDALFSTATDLPPGGLDNRSGAGLVDLVAAANRIGGLGGISLHLLSWNWDERGGTLSVELFNRGGAPFPGGLAELQRPGRQEPLAQAIAPAIRSRARGAVVFAALRADPRVERQLNLRLESSGAVLDLPIALSPPSATALQIEAGAVQLSLDANGRFGRVAGPPGFTFLGGDWLTAGAFLFTAGGLVSDAAYVDVLGQIALKSNPVGSDTDWSGRVLRSDFSSAEVEYSDNRAVRPIGASLEQSARIEAVSDSAAFVLLTLSVDFERAADAPLAGLILDWDLGARDRVFWSSELGASVMAPLDSAGPWMGLTTTPEAPTTHTAVPIGQPVGGFFDFGSGVLADTVCFGTACSLAPFSDDTKSRLLRLGGSQSSNSGVSDWAQLVTAGPVRSGEQVSFIIAAASSEPALRVALDSARAFAELSGLGEPAVAGAQGLELLPAFPNPFNPADGEVVNLPFVVRRGDGEVQASLEIFTIAGRLVHSERRDLAPAVPLEPFRWDGRLRSGEVAATGVYGYLLQVGREKKSAKLLLIK